jgi:hypothetical protein
MKKKIYLTATVVLVAAVSFGLYQYFRAPAAAIDLRPVYSGKADQNFISSLQQLETGAVVELQDTIRSAESKSITLSNGVIVVRDSADLQTWPTSGYIAVKGFYQGIEIDNFFGDTLIRVGGAFLLEGTQPEHLD